MRRSKVRSLLTSMLTTMLLVAAAHVAWAQAADDGSPDGIVHDAEYYILEAQNGERWAAEDKELEKKLAELRQKNGGKPPNIVYILWDDTAFGAVLQERFIWRVVSAVPGDHGRRSGREGSQSSIPSRRREEYADPWNTYSLGRTGLPAMRDLDVG